MSVLSATPSKAIFEEVAQNLGVNESFIEKDWYAMQVIAVISKINSPDFELIFSGGTALSKAHGLIQRFSEDLDFRVMADHDSLTRGMRSNLKKSIIKALQVVGFSINTQDVMARDENRFFAIKIEYESQFLRSNALRPHVLLEMSLYSPELPPKKLNVQSFIAASGRQLPEVGQMSCVSAIEIAAEKLSAIAWRIPDRIRGEPFDDPSIVRHIHDLAILESLAIQEKSFIELAKKSICRDNNRSKRNKNFSGLSTLEKFNQMLNILDNDAEYIKEYDYFVKGVSYAPQELILDFKTAVKAVRKLAEYVSLG